MIILLNEIDGFYEEKFSICRENIYAGCVMKYNVKNGKSKPCRKILFYKNEDNTITDFLYDSPNYTINNNGSKFYVSNIVNLNKLLEYYNYHDLFDMKEIRYIFNTFISAGGAFYKDDHRSLPMTLEEYATLEVISQLRKQPTLGEKRDAKKFKTKIKTYTFK
ncbi:MAG: hypothetical protein E7166_03745 [Firmicutes bacterium]|nr:hypothetical protein [Bacillota bacterium]